MSPEVLYAQLRELAVSVPNLNSQPLDMNDPEILRWLGRLSALVNAQGNLPDLVGLNGAVDNLPTVAQQRSVSKIMVILYRALARAEINAPAESRGSFIAAGSPFDALAAISGILAGAHKSIRIIDPYLDEKVLTSFALMASEGVRVELLADVAAVKPSLKPTAAAWMQQYGTKRPIDIRVAPSRALHDRLIVVDSLTVWDLSQSIKDFAARSPASASKADTELSAMKIAAYDAIWTAATTL